MHTALFRVGDKVIYPNHGVGVVEQIASRSINGSAQQFYLLKIEASNLRVMIPFDNVGTVGVRPVGKHQELQQTLEYLRKGECHPSPDWKIRYKENSEKMRTGSLPEVAQVLKCLLSVCKDKPLSFREKKMLDRAGTLLCSELASADNLCAGEALELVQKALSAAGLVLPEPDQTDA